MRTFVRIAVFGLVIAAPLAAAAAPQEQTAVGDEEGRQARQHWLYDKTAPDDAALAAATDGRGDGNNANAHARCRTEPVRVKRSDGAYAIRWIKRCD